MTNATKANLIATLNAVLGLLVVFGVNLTDVQVGAILAVANALAVTIVGLTYRDSRKRRPDPLI